MEHSKGDRLGKRRQAFVEAARALFIEKGFERTALADVVERSGGSLATLYKLFGNKAGLLTAVVQEQVRSGESLIEEIGSRTIEPSRSRPSSRSRPTTTLASSRATSQRIRSPSGRSAASGKRTRLNADACRWRTRYAGSASCGGATTRRWITARIVRAGPAATGLRAQA